jgi:crossover junction endodeoxyribonuclease RuvC
MRVLGIDCGTEFTGFGVVDQQPGGALQFVTAGAIRLYKQQSLPVRLGQVFEELQKIILTNSPEVVAIEEVFYSVNAKTALKLGQVRGVAMLAASYSGLQVAEYSPLAIKSAVVGYGKADKLQVQSMIMRLLKLAAPPGPLDASDALAIAICHLHTASTLSHYQAMGRG